MNLNNLFKTLGPGILFASTAIGVSHLVQSTRAGAEYGFSLLLFVVLANIFKYPFFEFGSRYANVTGETIIDGYKRMGRLTLLLYFIVTFFSMFVVSAAVGTVTAGFFENLFGFNLNPFYNVLLLFLVIFFVLFIGKYSLLDGIIKVIAIILLFSTIASFFLVLLKGPSSNSLFVDNFNFFDAKTFPFIIALMGWMPCAIDLSSWNSLWTLERINQTGYKPKLKETLFDFNLGYFISFILAICFVTLGAYLMFNTGVDFHTKSDKFANQVVSLYTTNFGGWSYYIISLSAFSIMLGTCFGVFDGYARTLQRISDITIFNNNNNHTYKLSLLVIFIGSLFVVNIFQGQEFKKLIDFATILSFVIAPFIAYVNYKLVTGPFMNNIGIPPFWLKLLSILGIIFLSLFAIFYILSKFNLVFV